MKKKILLFTSIVMIFTITACNKEQAGNKLQKQNVVEKAISAQVNKEIDEQVKKLEDEEKAATSSASDTEGQIVTENGQVLGATSDFEAKLKEAKIC